MKSPKVVKILEKSIKKTLDLVTYILKSDITEEEKEDVVQIIANLFETGEENE